MAGRWRRDTSFVTATLSTVTSSSAAFGRWAFGIGQPHRDRRGRMDIVKGRSVRSDAIAWTMLSCSGSGISAICFALTRPTTIRLGRICRSTRMRRHRALFIPLVALCRRHFSVDFITNMSEFDFRQAQLQEKGGTISILELEAKLDDIREAMKRDALPLDMEHVDPPAAELAALDELTFVRQLRTVGVGSNRLQFAKRDYYRAFTQRSQWMRQSLLFDGEVARFEKTLIEEWQPRFAGMGAGLDAAFQDTKVRQAGQEFYHVVYTGTLFPFPNIAAPLLMARLISFFSTT